MITFNELLSGHSIHDVELAHQHNLQELLKRINIIRTAWGKPMTISSGYRFEQDHRRIYAKINKDRETKGLSPVSVPWGSQHLKGAAVDIYDPDGELMKWVKANEKLLEQVGLWVEDDTSAPRVHFQIFPPKSGKRFFNP